MKKIALYSESLKRYIRCAPGQGFDGFNVSWSRARWPRVATFYHDDEVAKKTLESIVWHLKRNIRNTKRDVKAYETYVLTFTAANGGKARKALKPRVQELCTNYQNKWYTEEEVLVQLRREQGYLKKFEKDLTGIQTFVPTLVDIPIAFDKRRIKDIKFENLEASDKTYCACCGVLIPHAKALKFEVSYCSTYHICLICLKRMGESSAPVQEEFERENVDFMEGYQAEKFVMDL
jgi:hypothetical protein